MANAKRIFFWSALAASVALLGSLTINVIKASQPATGPEVAAAIRSTPPHCRTEFQAILQELMRSRGPQSHFRIKQARTEACEGLLGEQMRAARG